MYGWGSTGLYELQRPPVVCKPLYKDPSVLGIQNQRILYEVPTSESVSKNRASLPSRNPAPPNPDDRSQYIGRNSHQHHFEVYVRQMVL